MRALLALFLAAPVQAAAEKVCRLVRSSAFRWSILGILTIGSSSPGTTRRARTSTAPMVANRDRACTYRAGFGGTMLFLRECAVNPSRDGVPCGLIHWSVQAKGGRE